MKNHLVLLCALILYSTGLHAHGPLSGKELQPALADLSMLKMLNIPVLHADPEIGVGYAVLTAEMQMRLSEASHQAGRCGGFEALPEEVAFNTSSLKNELASLRKIVQKERQYENLSFRSTQVPFREEIANAVSEVDEENIETNVRWLSSFPTRYNRAPTANDHVFALKERLDQMLQNSGLRYEISTVDHNSTPQKSLKVHIPGTARANEIVVLGGHLDSIVGWGGSSKAPGADDNASGSSSLIEALRVISSKGQPERTIEFMWYGGEESGLLGSAEIARGYKAENKDVIGVLQLDMTMYPGSGEFTISSISDFTSAWLRDYLLSINNHYLKVQIISDKCGYACSDHASWYRQGYPSLMPFESTTSRMNPNIHTTRDIIDNNVSFKHAAVFSKIAVVFAMDLANSDMRSPL